ncbi:MAG TPA: peptide chain release factor-like protein [Candidatus Hydrogenedentes bacterium]|nr:peptide chain release factor-like protein [Candidatus Hydrogenedentota bacterium]
MSIFGVTQGKEQELLERMAKCGIREEDLDETFVRSGGPGGQKVNKSATAVSLTHRPSGLTVKTQSARSQALNRFHARRRLCELMEERVLGNAGPAALRREKIRKQKARRKRRGEVKRKNADMP